MNPTIKTIATIFRLFAKFGPGVASTVEGFIAALQQKASTQTAPVTLADVHDLATEHGMNMHEVNDFVGGLTPAGQ